MILPCRRRSYSSGAKVFEDVLHFGAAQILAAAKAQHAAAQQAAAQPAAAQPAAAGDAAAAPAPGGDTEMADAPAAAPTSEVKAEGQAEQKPAEAAPAAGYSEEQVQQLLAADPAALLEEHAKEQQQPAAGEAAAAAGGEAAPGTPTAAAAPASCALGQPGSGLDKVVVVDLSGVRSELDDSAEVEGEGEEELDAEDGTAGTTAGAAGEAEASRAEAAALAARQWEALLHDSWQELQREEEAALRAAGHEADAGDEEGGDEDADDVSRGVWDVERSGGVNWVRRGGTGTLGLFGLGEGISRFDVLHFGHFNPPALNPNSKPICLRVSQEDFGARRTSSLVTGPSADYEEELWSKRRAGRGK